MELRERLQPVSRCSGFRMDGYFVWCASVIEVDGVYHLFAARWPEPSGFPDGYRNYSEIVRATSRTALGPYEFQEVVVAKRAGDFWDGGMAHNPAICRYKDGFALFYIGSREGSHYREIGVATADRVVGPWRRPDRPLDLGIACDANNPAALFEADGSVKLMWRTKMLEVFVSSSPCLEGPYSVIGSHVWPTAQLEDFFLFRRGGRYHVLCEDNKGGVTGHVRWGARLVSPDGGPTWAVYEPEPLAYDHTIPWIEGGSFTAVRRERPWLLIERGAATCLFTGVYDGVRTWNQPVPIAPVWPIG